MAFLVTVFSKRFTKVEFWLLPIRVVSQYWGNPIQVKTIVSFKRVRLSIEFASLLHIGQCFNVFEFLKKCLQFVVVFCRAEAERTLEEHSLSLTFFTVFTIPVSYWLSHSNWCHVLSKNYSPLRSWKVSTTHERMTLELLGDDNLKFLCTFLISIGFAFVFFFYTASFNGNAIIAFQARSMWIKLYWTLWTS